MEFVGRTTELAALEAAAVDHQSHLWPVYGRRRVGKTALLRRLCANRPSIFFTGTEAPAPLTRRKLLEAAANAFDAPILRAVAPTDWQQALELVVQTGLSAVSGKLILVLDEFQWLAAASPELPSVIQALWDHAWAESGRVMLVLCGSSIGFMEREVLGHRSPLFGRRTGKLLLEPMSYREARLLHPSWSLADAARAWFLCGGIPHYHSAFAAERSVEENLRDTILDSFGALHGEPDFLLREELRDLPSYHAILMAIAGGSTRVTDIARASTLDRTRIPYYLQQLTSLRYVRKRYPLTGSRPSRNAVRYAVDDPLLGFWFRFVYPHLGTLEAEGAGRFLETHVLPGLDAWFGARFEALCRQALIHVYRAEEIPGGFEVGEFWSRDAQIDVVALRQDGRTDLGECEWPTLRSWQAPLGQLDRRLGAFPNPRGATFGRLLFARSGPAERPPGIRCFDLEDLYATG